jgi:GTP cyclohydrolase I
MSGTPRLHLIAAPEADPGSAAAKEGAAAALSEKVDALLAGRRRELSPEQRARFEAYAREMLGALGLDLSAPGTADTPRRFVQAMIDATEGYDGDPKLVARFPREAQRADEAPLGQVVEGPIPFFSLCEHHALPFQGRAFVGYVARRELIGLSKLTRLVRVFAKRFTLQERLVQQVADTLEALVQPHGVAVLVEAQHRCTQMRGVRNPEPVTQVLGWRGEYERNSSLRSEFLTLCGRRS